MKLLKIATELKVALNEVGVTEVLIDEVTRILYSTDASIYSIKPLGVVFPRHTDEIQAIMETCANYQVPVIARGTGSGLAGQAIGAGLVMDCSRYLQHIIEIDAESQVALVEPGVILNTLNREARKFGLQFGPDPASGERATIGGSLANNATGAHSIQYGMAGDHLLAAKVVLSDGSLAYLSEIPLDTAQRKGGADNTTIEASLYRTALKIRHDYRNAIIQKWPKTWRCSSGYNLPSLLHWSPARPPQWDREMPGSPYPLIKTGMVNLSKLFAGSEGTLALLQQAKLHLTPVPRHTVVIVLAFTHIAEACDATIEILHYQPSAVELIPGSLINIARSIPAYAKQMSLFNNFNIETQQCVDFLAVEFSGDDPKELLERASKVGFIGIASRIAETLKEQKEVWDVRKIGLGLILSKAGDTKPWSFIEDLAVPVEKLGEFVRQFEMIQRHFGIKTEIYGHASAGCLHIRPMIELKTLAGIRMMRQIAEQAVDLVISLNGAVSGEHGDGLARSEWGMRMFGTEIMQAFRDLKKSADPAGLLNPGKIVAIDPEQTISRMDENLRYGLAYNSVAWEPFMDFSSEGGLEGAIEQCNGAGVCRKNDGVMCPSFQASLDEKHSTRGRANLLRAMISGKFEDQALAERAVYEALDLCLACKGCKAECPSAVDMAKLKYEYLNVYYKKHRRRWRDYVFGYIDRLAYWGGRFAWIMNSMQDWDAFRRLLDRYLGITKKRKLLYFSKTPLSARLSQRSQAIMLDDKPEIVLLLLDAFSEYFYPEIGEAAINVLQLAGADVRVLPVIGAGRTLISKGFLDAARHHAIRLVDAIAQTDPTGAGQILGLEPSEIYTLDDEYVSLLPDNERVRGLAGRIWTIEEWLVRPRNGSNRARIELLIEREAQKWGQSMGDDIRVANTTSKKHYIYHNHCYQKAKKPANDGYPIGGDAIITLIKTLNQECNEINSGCCGMAGAFGYESDHYDLSMQIGELGLFPQLRKLDNEQWIIASGISCREQIKAGVGREVLHPIQLVNDILSEGSFLPILY